MHIENGAAIVAENNDQCGLTITENCVRTFKGK